MVMLKNFKLKTMFIFVLLLSILLTACTKEENRELDFCQKLSKCESASLEIKDSKTNDIYELSILGLKNNSCSIKLSAEELTTEQIKFFEKTSVTCTQEWNTKFRKIADFDTAVCKKYVDFLAFNLLTNAADPKGTICTGELRERLIAK